MQRIAATARKHWPRFGRDLLYTKLQGSILVPKSLRWRMLRWLGMDVEPCWITPGNTFTEKNMRIGRDCFINYGCFFDAAAPITLGNEVFIGMTSRLVTTSHRIGGPRRRAGKNTKLPITVGNGTWIGAGATILPGVTIGEGCVIAAGSVVTRDCEPHGMYAGVPARFVRPADEPIARTA